MWIQRLDELPSEKYVHIHGCQKMFTIQIQHYLILNLKNGVSIIFLAALKKIAIWHPHPYYVRYREYWPALCKCENKSLASIQAKKMCIYMGGQKMCVIQLKGLNNTPSAEALITMISEDIWCKVIRYSYVLVNFVK